MTGAEIPVAMAIAGAEAGTAMGATAASMLPAMAGTAAAGTAAGLGATGAGMLNAGMSAAPFASAAPTFAGLGGASPFAASAMAPEAAMPFFTEAASLGAAGDPMAMGLTMAQPSLSMGAPAPVTGMDRLSAFMDKANPMLKGMSQASQMMGDQQRQQPAPAQRPPQTAQPMSNAEVLRKMAELRQLPGRSNFAGLLGNFQ